MDMIVQLLTGTSIGQSIFVLALVVSVGLLLSKIKLGGFSLGVTWVLFSGILAGHLGLSIDPTVLCQRKWNGNVYLWYWHACWTRFLFNFQTRWRSIESAFSLVSIHCNLNDVSNFLFFRNFHRGNGRYYGRSSNKHTCFGCYSRNS